MPADWQERYDRRVENARLPESAARRETYAAQVGADGYLRQDALDRPGTPAELPAPPAVAVLRRVWARHFERAGTGGGDAGGGGAPGIRFRDLRTARPGGQAGDPLESPYDPDARFRRTRGGREWVGHMAHLTETCDEHAPRLIGHADTTDAGVHEAVRTTPIHAALAAKGLAPSQHLADTACMGADLLIAARERYGIDLIGPQHRDRSWRGLAEGAFDAADFAVGWDERAARCPEGKRSASRASYRNGARPHRGAFVQVRFRSADCRPCPSRARCARSATRGRYLNLYSRREHEALVGARVRQGTDAYRRLHAERQGIEATMSQGVRAFGLRRARYRGLAKAALRHLATAAAINLDRLAAWLAGRPLAPKRVPRFAALAA